MDRPGEIRRHSHQTCFACTHTCLFSCLAIYLSGHLHLSGNLNVYIASICQPILKQPGTKNLNYHQCVQVTKMWKWECENHTKVNGYLKFFLSMEDFHTRSNNQQDNMLRQSLLLKVNCVIRSKVVRVIFPPSLPEQCWSTRLIWYVPHWAFTGEQHW